MLILGLQDNWIISVDLNFCCFYILAIKIKKIKEWLIYLQSARKKLIIPQNTNVGSQTTTTWGLTMR